MKIERINENTVKCFISNEEMQEYEISYKDFVVRSEKAKEIVEEIIMQAKEEVGYRPPQFAFDLQVMAVPEQGMVLTFSEGEPDGTGQRAELMECLKDMKDILNRRKDEIAQQNRADGVEGTESGSRERIPEDIVQSIIEEAIKNALDRGKKQKDIPGGNGEAPMQGEASGKSADQVSEKEMASKEKQSAVSTFAVFRFAELRDVMDFAGALPVRLQVKSSLYGMDGEYYLYLDKGRASYDRFSRSCILAMEYADLYTAARDGVAYLAEHGECVIAEGAVKKLRM